MKHDYVGYTFLDESDRAKMGALLNRTASVDCMEAVAMLISSGCFVGSLPDHYVQSLWRLRKFKSILPEVFSFETDIEFITRRGTASPLILAFLDILDDLSTPVPAASQKRGTAGAMGRIAYEIG